MARLVLACLVVCGIVMAQVQQSNQQKPVSQSAQPTRFSQYNTNTNQQYQNQNSNQMVTPSRQLQLQPYNANQQQSQQQGYNNPNQYQQQQYPNQYGGTTGYNNGLSSTMNPNNNRQFDQGFNGVSTVSSALALLTAAAVYAL